MRQSNLITKQEFSDYYKPVVKSYSESFNSVISSLSEIEELIYHNVLEQTVDNFLVIAKGLSDVFMKSLMIRVIGVREIRHCREKDENLDVYFVWSLISQSVRIIPEKYTISSIGSQGFLSIPLYKEDASIENFDFIRLHIWDDSLSRYIDLKKCNDFSIHSHAFFAKSWVVSGKIKNDRYEFVDDSKNSNYSLFEVQYNNSLNEVNQHSSKAVNKNIDVTVVKVSEEVYLKNGSYEMKPSRLHKSGHLNSPSASATFFSFSARYGLGESFVIGPKSIEESEINRKMYISPMYLLDKIDGQL